jgi:23S rRNA (cytidine1920-2'-O)/16S rRNA (cytidine1409-2'-O)-methyltransferase
MSDTQKVRLDRVLAGRALARSRERAQSLISGGHVLVNGQLIKKSGTRVALSDEIRILGETSPYVSRGGTKLEHVLESFNIRVADSTCLDIGASTGGFTDCLLAHGARKVFAVDVGTSQLDSRIRADARVVVLERTNARYLRFEQIGEAVDLVTVDVSFISATLILPLLPQFLEGGGGVLVLVKPQFEVGKQKVGASGVVRDPRLHWQAIRRVSQALQESGFDPETPVESVPGGASGNREFFIYARYRAPKSS